MYSYHVKEMVYVSSCRKTLLKFGVLLVLLSMIVTVSILPQLLNKDVNLFPRHARFPTDLKYILFWTPLSNSKNSDHGSSPKYPIGQNIFIKQNCPYINCYLTYNKSLLKREQDFDAIIFNGEDINKYDKEDLQLRRSQYQKYIFKSLESSEKNPVCDPMYDDFFNWTWTYKLDSDIPSPFFNIYDDKNKLVGPKKDMKWVEKMKHNDRYKSLIKNKDKAVMWIIPKCKVKNKHQDFIRELKDELKSYNYTIDTYGTCGKNKCPEGKISKCYKIMEKRYFFQLDFEETFAEDYINERIVKTLTHLAIPIVLGGADYTRFLPPGSYINTQIFDMKKLCAIIDYLIKNPNMYEYFFDWKNHYYYAPKSKSYICDLCSKLNNNSAVKKSYAEFRQWWNPDYKDACQRMQLLSLFRNK
ncbi:alpha-(1,3)-fucosyltransferase C-like [Manduca sexta]|uniref:alpha-(1,3)-fucosyltransferase C-like n=1 Tax=Manduca sexta TaxID=7130 RepID=UPI00118239AE|nr:alpha-(1,3)-fucosyltransferase C-like [Manduca sexta]